ncbi:MAG: hypothetical protein Sapg2KO_12440 [Saprospiraceae bacterium]
MFGETLYTGSVSFFADRNGVFVRFYLQKEGQSVGFETVYVVVFHISSKKGLHPFSVKRQGFSSLN